MTRRNSRQLTLFAHSPVHLDFGGDYAFIATTDSLAQILEQSGCEGAARSSGEEEDSLVDTEVAVGSEATVRAIK